MRRKGQVMEDAGKNEVIKLGRGGIEMSLDTGKLFTALSEAQGELYESHKDKQGYGYNYADLASILVAVRPVLAKHGLSVIQCAAPADNDKVSIITMIAHKSSEFIKLPDLEMAVEAKKGLSRAQCVGMVITYARRYALQAALNISSTDDDTDASIQEEVPVKKKDDPYDGWDVTQLVTEAEELLYQLDIEKKQDPGTARGVAISFKGKQLKGEYKTLDQFTASQLKSIIWQAKKSLQFENEKK